MQPIITTIDLLRHGECEGGHCYRGSLDVALTDNGKRQMENSLDFINPIWDRVISSPLIRCAYFAEKISQQQKLPLLLESKLQEISFGSWEGQSVKKVWETQKEAVDAWVVDPVRSPPPMGEAADHFASRVTSAFSALVEQYRGEHFLFVSHGGVIRVLLAHCLEMPLTALNRIDVPYGCVSQIQVIADQEKTYYRLLSHNLSSGRMSSDGWLFSKQANDE